VPPGLTGGASPATLLRGMTATFFESQAKFRQWLKKHHDSVDELWIGFYKKASGKPSITYKEALDEALCYGWIDGVKKRVDDEVFVQRFTPRQSKSHWSEVNIKRVGELTKLGLMMPPGDAAFERRTKKNMGQYSYENRPREFSPAHEARFKKNKKAWEFFQAQAPSYRRTVIWYVVSAVKEETQSKRLDAMIARCASGTR
jgi:uncharacterized protein YdeI (YjbR/CyaY-like superfamily)